MSTPSIELHKKLQGKIEIVPKQLIQSPQDLAQVYTPGVAEVCRGIHQGELDARDVTITGRTIAVITDGTAILGLGNIGPRAGMPVMEGKAVLFKQLGGVDAMPLCLQTKNAQETIDVIRALAPTFAGINLEDIAAPDCFLIEDSLQDLGIPVFHDDQHATAVVVYAGLMNAVKLLPATQSLKIVINGAGAAGMSIARMLAHADPKDNIHIDDIIVCDSRGIIGDHRTDMNHYKEQLAIFTNKHKQTGTLADALVGAHVCIGVSQGNTISKEMIRSMAEHSIIFALANPTPEIMPDEAKQAGAFLIATGRSDFPNQVNNVLAFPGLFKAALHYRYPRITEEMKYQTARAIAGCIDVVQHDMILPHALDPRVPEAIVAALHPDHIS